MRIIELTKESRQNLLNDLLKRSPNNYGQFESTVNEIIENVKNNGDKAVFEYTEKFDKFRLTPENIKVTRAEIDEAYTKLDASLIEVLKQSAEETVGLTRKRMAPS
jgi:histidinol dehydrogenase